MSHNAPRKSPPAAAKNHAFDVLPTETGSTLLAFLKSKFGTTYSARQLKRAIEENLCQVNGRTERFASYPLGSGDSVTIAIDNLSNTSKLPSFDLDRILFEDDAILIYNKPPGTPSDNPELLSTLQRDLPYLALAHRLDRDTTGALLFAKSPKVLKQIESAFKKRLINKQYLALVDGAPRQMSGTIDNFLGEKRRYQGQTLWGEVSKELGQHAITAWECLHKGKDASLVQCTPLTGRTHQIRVHLSGIGHPILGDFQYGRQFRCAFKPKRILLHAYAISFMHPVTGQEFNIQAPLPEDFRVAIEELIGKNACEF